MENLSIARDHYRNVRYLNQGSFGRVFHAFRLIDGRKVAIKEVNLDTIGNKALSNRGERDNFRKNALRMYDAIAASRHWNLVEIFACYSEGDIVHVVMEYCDRGTMEQVIQGRDRATPFSEASIWQWTAQLARALSYLHNDHKILHRDVKNANIYVMDKDCSLIKLGDFGIAKHLDRMNQFLTRPAALAAMAHNAPELFSGQDFNAKSEIWSLGVVVHQMATLVLPFKGTEETIMFGILRGKPIPAIPGAHYSEGLQSFVHEKLLNKDPNLRLSASQILEYPQIKAALHEMSPVSTSPACSPPSSPLEKVNMVMPTGQVLPFEKMASKQVQAISPSATGRDYYQVYPKKPRDLFQTTSWVIAIIAIPNEQDKNSTPTLLLVCWKGEVIALSSRDWATVDWRCKVTLQTGNKIQFNHAVYDDFSKEVYFVNGRGDVRPIFRTSLAKLVSAANNGGIVELDLLADEAQVDGRRFASLTIDSQNRLLYACDAYGTNHGDISIWLLPSRPGIGAQLIGSIKTLYKPWFCSFYLEPGDKGPLLYLAVTDYDGNRIDLLAADCESYVKELARFYQENSNKPVIFKVGKEKIFKRIAFIAQKGEDENELGSVSYPRELAFDGFGNLFISQNGSPERIQAFAFENTPENGAPKTMKGVWASEKVGPSCYRVAMCQSNHGPCLITQGSLGADNIAVFEHQEIS